jgi:hypothetical protein
VLYAGYYNLGWYGSASGYFIIDFSNPLNPIVVNEFYVHSLNNRGVGFGSLCCNLSGTDLVIADNRSNRILTYDATDITNPILQDEFRWNLQTSSIDFDGENLILNNWVNGITELDWNQFLSVNELPIINKDIFLTNFPNPFNPETKISFSVTQNSDFVNLDIYNIRGQKVDQLEITNYELGINEVTWDAKKFASGIYMYQLKVDGKAIASKKCLLLK